MSADDERAADGKRERRADRLEQSEHHLEPSPDERLFERQALQLVQFF